MAGSRRVAMGLLFGLTVTSAGCLGVLLGTDSLTFAADDATVQSGALESTGYQEYRDASPNGTQTFSVAGQNRTVTISSEVHAYNRTGTLAGVAGTELGRVVVLSTPAVEIAGQTLNPLGDVSSRDLVRQLQGFDGDAGALAFQGNRSVRALGASRTVSAFQTTVERNGTRVDTTVHTTSFRHGSDFVVVVAVHPSRVDGEPGRTDRLLTSLRHSTDS